MESSRSLSPLESGGWPFGTERSSSHPTFNFKGDPLKELFEQKLEQADPVGHRNSSGPRQRKVDIHNSDPSERAAKRSESGLNKEAVVHKNAHDRESISEPGSPRQSLKGAGSDLETENHTEAPLLPASQAPETTTSGGPLIQLGSSSVEGSEALSGTAGFPIVPAATPGGGNALPQATATQAAAGAKAVTGVVQAPPAGSAEASSSVPKAPVAGTSKAAQSTGEAAKPPTPEVDMERTAEIFRQMRMQLTPSTRHATINLVPADLGRIVIHLTVRGGRVTGDIRADKEDTLKILEAHAPELRAALEQNGFESTDLNLSRHGDPSSGRSGEETFPLSETISRKRSGVPEVAPAKALSILREDRVDTLA